MTALSSAIIDPMDPEPERPATKGERTRRALLDAAVARFARDGYRGTSVAEIARDAQLSGTAAYAYFPNKEALFVAAVDEDAAGVINEGLLTVIQDPQKQFDATLIFSLLASVDRHPLARRILAGLEPEFTVRLLHIPALEQVRKVSGERLLEQQLAGELRADVDPDRIANGLVSIVLSVLMSLVQTGADPAELLGPDVLAVFEAVLSPPPEPGLPRSRKPSRAASK